MKSFIYCFFFLFSVIMLMLHKKTPKTSTQRHLFPVSHVTQTPQRYDLSAANNFFLLNTRMFITLYVDGQFK